MSLVSSTPIYPVTQATSTTNAALVTTTDDIAYTTIIGFINSSIYSTATEASNTTTVSTASLATFLTNEQPNNTIVVTATGDLTAATTAQIIANYTAAGYTVTSQFEGTTTIIKFKWPSNLVLGVVPAAKPLELDQVIDRMNNIKLNSNPIGKRKPKLQM